jgi:hypothetical protein
MNVRQALVTVCIATACGRGVRETCAADVVISGTVRALDGDPLTFTKLNEVLRAQNRPSLQQNQDFQLSVQANQTNRPAVFGTFNSGTGEFTIRLLDNQFDPQVKVIDVLIRSLGGVQLDSVRLLGLSITSQTIQVTMPLAKQSCCGYCVATCRRRCR